MYSTEKKELLCHDQDTVFLKQMHVDYISERDKEILCDIGIPAKAEPLIRFYGEDEYGGYSLRERACKVKGGHDKKAEAAGGFADDLCVIGESDWGSIVIDKQGRIWTIIGFDDELKFYANNSLDDFLDCLYVYRKQVDSIRLKHGDAQKELVDIVAGNDIKQLEKELLAVNSDVLNECSFWHEEISQYKQAKEEELIEYVKPRLKALGFKKKAKRWTKVTEHFTYIFFIEGSYLDKRLYFVRPSIVINGLTVNPHPFVHYGHLWKDIEVTTKAKILNEALEFFSEWTSIEYLKERAAAYVEWDKRNPLEKRRAGLVDYKADPVPEALFYSFTHEALEQILEL